MPTVQAVISSPRFLCPSLESNWPKKSAAKMCHFKLAEKLAKDREKLQQQLEILLAWLRDLMVAKASGRTDWLVNNDRNEAVASQAESLPMDAILDGLRAVHAAMDNLARNANPRLSTEDLLLRLREVLPSGLSAVSA